MNTMKRTAGAGAALALAFTTGCAFAPARFETTHDQFENITKDRMTCPYRLGCEEDNTGNLIDAGNALLGIHSPTMFVSIELQRARFGDGRITYSMIVKYAGKDWLFIGEGESLVMLIDGKRVGFSGKGSGHRRDVGASQVGAGVGVTEEAWYDVTFDQIRQIASARYRDNKPDVKVKLSGDTTYVERCFIAENLESFKQFVAQYPPK
jgi:hypothetical protein